MPTNIYLLQHVSHLNRQGLVQHRDRWGQLLVEPELEDDVKTLGYYSTLESAEKRLEDARELPGFWNEPDCFLITKIQVDLDDWTEGFITAEM